MKTKLQSDGTIMPRSSAAIGCAVATFDSLDLLEGAYELKVMDDPEYYTNSSVIVRATNDQAIMQVIEIEKKPTGNITGRIQNTAAG